jgi:membrane-bound ClpP family serine protease
VTALGVSLLLIGATLVVVETHVQSLGMLGAPGVIALVVGSVLAVGGLGGGLALILTTALVLGFASAALLAFVLRKGASARRRKIRTGREALVGQVGVVRSWGEPTGRVLVDGALWRARRAWSEEHEDEPHSRLQEGDAVVIERLNGLTLAVRRAEEWELAP